MKKVYRISVFNRKTESRELMYEEYKTREDAQNLADAMNELDPRKIIDAKVVEKNVIH